MLETPAGEPLPSLSDITRSASSMIKIEFLWSIKKGMIVGSDNISAIDGGIKRISFSLIKLVKYFIYEVKRRYPDATEEEFADHLANYIEINPACIDVNGTARTGRYYYSTVGYGVMSLFGEKYRMGRIEIFDSEDESGYAVDEGIYTMPFVAANQFEDFMESLETDLPINIEIGSHKWCESECAKSLGFKDSEEMGDPEKVKEYRRKKNDDYAREQGYKDWDDLMANSKFAPKNREYRRTNESSLH